jgi:hypothetical protein
MLQTPQEQRHIKIVPLIQTCEVSISGFVKHQLKAGDRSCSPSWHLSVSIPRNIMYASRDRVSWERECYEVKCIEKGKGRELESERGVVRDMCGSLARFKGSHKQVQGLCIGHCPVLVGPVEVSPSREAPVEAARESAWVEAVREQSAPWVGQVDKP